MKNACGVIDTSFKRYDTACKAQAAFIGNLF
jgi:hypothetical protein